MCTFRSTSHLSWFKLHSVFLSLHLSSEGRILNMKRIGCTLWWFLHYLFFRKSKKKKQCLNVWKRVSLVHMPSGHTEMRKQCTAVILPPLLKEKQENEMAEENLLDSSDIFLSYQWLFYLKKLRLRFKSRHIL